MPGREQASHGLLASAKGLFATLIGVIYSRIELFSNELAEEREYVRGTAMLLVLAAISFSFAALLLTLLVVVAFWESHRLLAIGGMGVVYLAVGLGAMGSVRNRARSRPAPFAATLSELAKDRDALRQ